MSPNVLLKGRLNDKNAKDSDDFSSIIDTKASTLNYDAIEPTEFMNKEDIEKITDSQLYLQKRFFSFMKSKKIPSIPKDDSERKEYGYNNANFFSKLFFLWCIPIVGVGYKRTIQPQDLQKLTPEMKVAALTETFYKIWYKEVSNLIAKYKKEHPEEEYPEFPSVKDERHYFYGKLQPGKFTLVKVLYLTLLKKHSKAIIFAALGNCSAACNPLVTKRLINFVEEKQIYHSLHVNKGVGYAIAATLIMLSNGLLFNHFFYMSTLAGTQTKGIMQSVLLAKSFKLSSSSRNDYSNGVLTSMMSSDMQRLELAIALQPFLWGFIPPAVICLVLLLVNIGPVSLIGFAIFILLIFITIRAFKSIISIRIKANKETDTRVTYMREVLNSLKMIKFYAWEDAYEKNIVEVRSREVYETKKMLYTRNFFTALGIIMPTLSTLVTFLVLYKVGWGGKSVGSIFSSLSTFQVMAILVFFLPMSLSTGVDALIGLQRAQKLLLSKEEQQFEARSECEDKTLSLKLENCDFEWEIFDDDDVNDKESSTSSDNDGATSLASASYKEKGNETTDIDQKSEVTYDHEKQMVSDILESDNKKSKDTDMKIKFKGFHNASFEIKNGEFVMVTGAIGTGKTSLLNALAGMMPQLKGTVKQTGDLLLSGQPWIQNTTLKNNILFGSKLDNEKYNKVLDACSLLPDLDILPNGDQCELGDKGVNLSGGQKARLSLARTCYKDADIYLFDDVLSAVDSRVGKYIMDKCMLELLDGKTKILATHQLSLMDRVDKILFLNSVGEISFGTVAELMSSNDEFNRLVQFSQNQTEEEEEENDDEEEALDELAKLKKELTAKSAIILQTGNKEKRAYNSISFSVYKTYIIAACGKFTIPVLIMYALSVIFTTFCMLFSSVWLSFWTQEKFDRPASFYMGLYCLFVFGAFFFMVIQFTTLCTICLNAAKHLNLRVVKKLLHTKMSFLDVTPMGRILNVVSSDTNTLDNEISEQLRMFIYQLANLTGVIILCIIYMPWFAISIPFLTFLYVIIASHYQATGREAKRLESVQRSFVYNNINEVLSGMSTIKCYSKEKAFLLKSSFLIDKQNEAAHLTFALQRWAALFIDMVACLFALIIALLCITRTFHVNAASVGVMLTYVLQLPGLLNTLLRSMTQTENDMNSVERLVSYSMELPQEAAYKSGNGDGVVKPSPQWPVNGSIQFENVSMAYREGLPLVLKDLSFDIKDGEKIALVGRTGSGKSSTVLTLFRLVELAQGKIIIDGEDISNLGLYDLRKNLTIIPQDPVLFKNTIRRNLDPFGEYSDDQLWEGLVNSGAIEAHLLEQVKSQVVSKHASENNVVHKFHLDQMVQEDGVNYSNGERQVLALTRAVVKKSKILVLDEATSSVDYETDAKIQSKIAVEFKESTVITIAHRLNTILHYDKIMVLEKGEIYEFDKPLDLFLNEKSIFREMCEKASITEADFKH
ncbi:hypothetical protein QEN19_003862 [Hanseniaspora menglaensis]